MHSPSPLVDQVPASEWAAWREEHDAVVLDVREPTEWAQGLLPNAEKMALSRIASEWRRLDADRAVLVVCRTGQRSGQVAHALVNAGFARVANMSGGMAALGLA